MGDSLSRKKRASPLIHIHHLMAHTLERRFFRPDADTRIVHRRRCMDARSVVHAPPRSVKRPFLKGFTTFCPVIQTTRTVCLFFKEWAPSGNIRGKTIHPRRCARFTRYCEHGSYLDSFQPSVHENSSFSRLTRLNDKPAPNNDSQNHAPDFSGANERPPRIRGA